MSTCALMQALRSLQLELKARGQILCFQRNDNDFLADSSIEIPRLQNCWRWSPTVFPASDNGTRSLAFDKHLWKRSYLGRIITHAHLHIPYIPSLPPLFTSALPTSHHHFEPNRVRSIEPKEISMILAKRRNRKRQQKNMNSWTGHFFHSAWSANQARKRQENRFDTLISAVYAVAPC